MRPSLALFPAAVALLASCFLPGFEKNEGTTSSGGTGGSAGADVADPCSAQWRAPVPDTSGMSDPEDLWFAVRRVDLGEAVPSTAPGFDLDRACTCCPGCAEVATCIPPNGSMCDGPRGIDNSAATFFGAIAPYYSNGFSSAKIQGEIDAGDWSFLLRVSSYNGLDDDDQVTVRLYSVMPLLSPPVWDGTQEWRIRSDSLVPGGTTVEDAAIVATSAYVSGGELVAVFSNSQLWFFLGPEFILGFRFAVISAVLEGPPPFTLTNGVMAGRFHRADAFVYLEYARDEGVPVFCTDRPYYPDVKAALCSRLDLRQDDAPSACNSISFGMSFEALPARPGPIEVPPGWPPGCVLGTSPQDDTCP